MSKSNNPNSARLDAIHAQMDMAKRGTQAAEKATSRLLEIKRDVLDKVGSPWDLPTDAFERVDFDCTLLNGVKVVRPIELNSNFSELAPGITPREEATKGAKALRQLAQERKDLMAELKRQKEKWRVYRETYEAEEEKMREIGEKLLKGGEGWLARFVELETGGISMQGEFVMGTLLTATGTCIANAKSIEEELIRTLNVLEEDLKKFEESLKIGEWIVGSTVGSSPFGWKTADDIAVPRTDKVEALQIQIIERNARVFEEAAKLRRAATAADQAAARKQRLQSALRLTAALGEFAKAVQEHWKTTASNSDTESGGHVGEKPNTPTQLDRPVPKPTRAPLPPKFKEFQPQFVPLGSLYHFIMEIWQLPDGSIDLRVKEQMGVNLNRG